MSATFDDLREDFARAFEAIQRNGEAQRLAIDALAREQAQLWAENAELRDDLLALANRIEANTRG